MRKMIATLTLALCLALTGCSDDDTDQQDAAAADRGAAEAGADRGTKDAGVDAPRPTAKICKDLELTPRAFDSKGPFGTKRHAVVADFTLALVGGKSWKLSEQWTGCESYIFLPDTLRASQLSSSASIWKKDLATLVVYSPQNAHYFFVARTTASRTGSARKDMQARIDTVLAGLSATKQAHWKERLHVVSTHADDLKGWMKGVLGTGVGTYGFAVDRFQRLRGVGSLADVHRYSAALKAANAWPYEANMAYAAHEAMYYNFEAKRQARLDAEKVTEVKLWTGQVISQLAEKEATLPDAATMATFDTLELDVTQRCPKESSAEFGNCGAWDYISNFFVKDAAGKYQELTRLITTYHREGRWVVDMSPMLARLAKGGKQTFKWSWAPSWNKQPTATWLSLRFSNQKKGARPTKLVPLFTGGKFGADYNKDRKPMTVDIPATAKKVRLWAIISGHGMSPTNNCAEFCNHQHLFEVNGKTFKQEYAVASTKDGCMKAIDKGVVPNQWGTWWLGRGGWCPGQEVPPLSQDITTEAPAGKKATLSYKGQYQGGSPPSESKPGNIEMRSYLVIYE